MLEKVIENWTSRLDYIRASRGSPMPEIIFRMSKDVKNENRLHFSCPTKRHQRKQNCVDNCSAISFTNEIIPPIFQFNSARRITAFVHTEPAGKKLYFAETQLRKQDVNERNTDFWSGNKSKIKKTEERNKKKKKTEKRIRTATAGSDLDQSGRPIFDDFFQHLWPYIGNNMANVVFQIVKRLWLIRLDQ
ncbi:hypothetical protein TNCV_884301 [Trichonephila clavipes]|nr:hypothetical protein TNCV_884301 [Trichonephila clavipes]